MAKPIGQRWPRSNEDQAPVNNFITGATAAGVTHLTYVSSYAVGIEPMPAMGRWHNEREQLIRSRGIPATTLRPCGFMSNTIDWLATLRSDGHVLDPVGPGRAALMDPADIAAVAATTLTDPQHADRTHTLTGNQPLTVREQAQVLAEAIGREVDVRDVATPEEAVRFRYPDGAPPALAAAIIEGLRQIRADTKGLVTSDVEKVVGRPPRSFSDWCHRHADLFRTALALTAPGA